MSCKIVSDREIAKRRLHLRDFCDTPTPASTKLDTLLYSTNNVASHIDPDRHWDAGLTPANLSQFNHAWILTHSTM
jgi:hypothetical protein